MTTPSDVLKPVVLLPPVIAIPCSAQIEYYDPRVDDSDVRFGTTKHRPRAGPRVAQFGNACNIPAPPLGMGPGTGLGASFLGFQQRTGQANQARLAAAAQHLPRRPVLQSRRHHLNALSAPSSSQTSSALTQSRPARRSRGPASQRPHAHRQHPELSDVAYSPSGQGEPTHCHIRVKVLPDCGVRFQELYFDSSLINSQ